MQKIIAAAMAIIIAFTSCTKDTIIGGGSKATELRSLSGFSKIEVAGKTDVTISYGSSFKVEVSAYRNLLGKLETKLNGDVLMIGYKNGTNVSNDNSKVVITLPILKKISTSGNSQVLIRNGNTDDLEASIIGASKIEGIGFSTKNAVVSIEGSGIASLIITDKLNAKIIGSGIIYYKGNASVVSAITGSGKVEKL